MANQKETSDAEDIPSDFFDDFNKEEFMEGLSVIDSWGDEEGGKRTSRINAETVESVRDLRELIRDGRDDGSRRDEEESRGSRRRSSSKNLDDFIKPGSRRDPNKTNEAIRRDKEVKVKQYLAKHLESSDDLRPPGTELDDYYDDSKQSSKLSEEPAHNSRPREDHRDPTFVKHKHRSPHRSPRRSPHRSPRRSPRRSPHRSPRRSPRRRSPLRYRLGTLTPRPLHRQSWQPKRFSPSRKYGSRYSPPRRHGRDYSPPRRSPYRRSRSPIKRSRMHRRSHSRSSERIDNFLYPHEPHPVPGYTAEPYQPPLDTFNPPVMSEFPGSAPNYPYHQAPTYPGGYPPAFDYGVQPDPPGAMPVPQPVPAPTMNPVMNPMGIHMGTSSGLNIPLPSMVPAPAPVPVPAPMPSPSSQSTHSKQKIKNSPYDALAQLVAEGKLSKEDYLKLAPNKSKSARLFGSNNSSMDTKARVDVLNRCQAALSKLGMALGIPNQLVMSTVIGQEQKALAPKFCSPLKRQPAVEFHFTNPTSSSTSLHNKQLIDSIINTIGLTNVVARPKKKVPKNMKEASTQTTKPYCDVCEIRESMRYYDTATSIDPEHFSSSIHTQVVEQDLVSSKAVFNPSGSVADGAPISIAHMTPAQLVSQLAARAKTLKQTEPPPPSNPYGRRNPYDSYDYDGRGGQQYQNNNYNNYSRY